ILFFFSSRRRHTISKRDWSSDVCSSDLQHQGGLFDQESSQGDALLFPTGEMVHGFLLPSAQSDPFQGLGRVAPSTPVSRHVEVFTDGGVLDEGVVLEQVPQVVPAESTPCPRTEAGPVDVLEKNLRCGWGFRQTVDFECRGL